MKKGLSSMLALALFGSGVVFGGTHDAKDSVAAPSPPEQCSWTGFYLGLHGGYGWGGTDFTELLESDPPYQFDRDGFFGGIQAGYNYQVCPRWVLGLEGTFSWGDFDAHAAINGGGEISTGEMNSDWIATVAGRIGFTCLDNRLLIYAKGGVAFADFDYHTQEVGGQEQFNASESRIAPLVGVGVEYALDCHWSLKLEYNHIFFGSEDVTGVETEGPGRSDFRTFRADCDGYDTVQFGINYKF
ncbi:outer membrane beta-barrel protein [Luteolibacter sp. LG18]|uniref:outer membrane protein n=1 Tax=Luteolibacter sp. LG18 TaxID=2819286 RepID=UPI002B2FC02C|nr:porin [Luteolibacter sp. LG18]